MLLLQKQLKREEDKKRSLSHRKGLSSRRWNFKSTTGIYYHQFINTVLDLKYSFLKEAPEAYHSLEMQASLKIKVVHTLTQSQSCRNLTHLQANTHSPQATSIRHEEARQHILSLVMMQLHPAHSNSDLYRALKTSTAKTSSPNLNCTHRNLGQNPTLFLFRLQHAHCTADSKSQVLTTFQHHPTFPPQFFIPLAHSLPTHFYASLFKHWSDILFREKYINPSFLCSTDTTMLMSNSINKVMSLQVIFWGQEITLLTQAQWVLSCVSTAKNVGESCITCHWHCFHRLWQKLVGGEEGSHHRKRIVPWFRKFNYSPEN